MKGPSLWTQGLERGADADVQPSANGRPHVRLRSPEKAEPARPTITRRLARPLPLIGVALVLAALAGYWSVYSATTAQDTRDCGRTRPSGGSDPSRRPISAWPSLRATPRRWRLWSRSASSRRCWDESSPRRCRRERRSRGPRLPRRSSGPAAFTLVVPALRALGGSLRPGDRVTVLATFESGAGARARAVASGLRVLEVGQTPEGFDSASASIPVTVALPIPRCRGVGAGELGGEDRPAARGREGPHGADSRLRAQQGGS